MIVVDTHVIIWHALQPDKLSSKAQAAIALHSRQDGIIFCEISLWEIAMLIKKRRLTIATDYRTFIELVLAANNYILCGITPEIAELATTLPLDINNDPADRIIAASSVVRNIPLVTADHNLRASQHLHTIW